MPNDNEPRPAFGGRSGTVVSLGTGQPDDVSASTDEILALRGEARIRDVSLGRALEFERPRDIRPLIARHRAALSELGEVVDIEETVGRGQRVTVTYLNRSQSIFVAAKSETAKAAELVIGVIRKLEAFENGMAVSRPLTLAERRVQVQERNAAIKAIEQIRRAHGPKAAADSLLAVYHSAGIPVSLARSERQDEFDLPPGPPRPG